MSARFLTIWGYDPNRVSLRRPFDRKSRPVTPLTSPMEEYFSESSMASGDESDDEDLTEPDDCDSDSEGGGSLCVLIID